jgi:hypothetical protein
MPVRNAGNFQSLMCFALKLLCYNDARLIHPEKLTNFGYTASIQIGLNILKYLLYLQVRFEDARYLPIPA